MWKKKSIFWELPYWKVLRVRSSIDVMHVTKNLCVNLLGFLGVYGKTKDTPEARENQQIMKDPKNMHTHNKTDKGRHLSRVSYALTKAEKEIFFEVLYSIKVPSGFSSISISISIPNNKARSVFWTGLPLLVLKYYPPYHP